jgi:hypothetical protein
LIYTGGGIVVWGEVRPELNGGGIEIRGIIIRNGWGRNSIEVGGELEVDRRGMEIGGA